MAAMLTMTPAQRAIYRRLAAANNDRPVHGRSEENVDSPHAEVGLRGSCDAQGRAAGIIKAGADSLAAGIVKHQHASAKRWYLDVRLERPEDDSAAEIVARRCDALGRLARRRRTALKAPCASTHSPLRRTSQVPVRARRSLAFRPEADVAPGDDGCRRVTPDLEPPPTAPAATTATSHSRTGEDTTGFWSVIAYFRIRRRRPRFGRRDGAAPGASAATHRYNQRRSL